VQIERETLRIRRGVPTLADMLTGIPDGRAVVWRHRVLGVIGLLFLGVGSWAFFTHLVGAHVTTCGFDAKGAYAKVRVNNWLAGAHEQWVAVAFYVDGPYPQRGAQGPYDEVAKQVMVPARGRGTAIVHASFPPRRESWTHHSLTCLIDPYARS